ncbi:MAG: TipAS antibiotic-recognition domain-containing protein, partial [Clostridia bacterium]|nr:TipAS antibiotic-recognition domain-containing protein [Clostridia bacterium]
LLELKKEHLDDLIHLARGIKEAGVDTKMDFSAFDTKKMDEYAAQAKKTWGNTLAYREYEQKAKGRTKEETAEVNRKMREIFTEFGAIRHEEPASEKAQALVRKLQSFISEHFYTCTDQILSGLGQMYAAGGEMTSNIDSYGGEGTAVFTSLAIRIFCT